MQFINTLDYILLPIYIFIFYLIIRSRAAKYKNEGLDKYYITAFFLHIAGGVLYAMVIQYYYGYGDTIGFFKGANFITKFVKEDYTLKYFFYSGSDLSKIFFTTQSGNEFVGHEVVGYLMDNSANLIIMKISALLSFLSFNCYLIITLFFSLFSFIGLWKLFLTFNEILKTKGQKLLVYTVLYTPSIWFWGSGLIKDTICMGCMGIIVYGFYKFFIKKKITALSILASVISLYILYTVKNYIALTLIFSAFVYIIHNIIARIKSKLGKVAILTFIIFLLGVIVNSLLQNFIDSFLEDSKQAVDTLKSTYENLDVEGIAGSGFAGKDIDFSISGIILNSPFKIFTTIFRPFIWEVKNIMMLFSALESLIALAALVYIMVKFNVYNFFKALFSDSFTLASFCFVIILSLIIGFTTFNFGSMVRYRIPVLPFYAFTLISIFIKYKETKILNGNN